MLLSELNTLDAKDCKESFLQCCHSPRWADEMLSRRPFASFSALLKAAEEIWWQLSPSDWLEAFSAHPKIGDIDSLRAKYAATKQMSASEQSGVDGADERVLRELAQGNADYEKRFGHIFIVCATGKTAGQMLEILKTRINNDPQDELKIAADEQRKITKIRLEKLCQEVPSQHTC